MIPEKFLPLLRVSGNNYEIGLQIGKHFKDRIKKAFARSILIKALLFQDKMEPDWFDKLNTGAIKSFPDYVEELSGIADGSGLNYRDIAIVNFRHSFPPLPQYNCSTVVFKNSNKIILGHNEDHEAIFGEFAYLLNVKLNNGTCFFTHAYPGCLPGTSFAFNSHDITISCNAISRPFARIGIPRALLDRSMLEAETMNETLKKAQIPGRSGSFSYNVVSMKEKKAVNLETTSKKSQVTEISDKYFHSNHFISEKLKKFSVAIGSTKNRYDRGRELIQNAEKTSQEALKILSDEIILVKIKKSKEVSIGNNFLGDYYSGTSCTAVFEINNSINLKIYPNTKERKVFLEFKSDDIIV